MGIETLNSAAYAAGFAMAAPEEAYEDLEALPSRVDSSPRLAEPQWQPSRGVLAYEKVHATPGARSDWLGLLLGLVGRRPVTRRPTLAAEA